MATWPPLLEARRVEKDPPLHWPQSGCSSPEHAPPQGGSRPTPWGGGGRGPGAPAAVAAHAARPVLAVYCQNFAPSFKESEMNA